MEPFDKKKRKEKFIYCIYIYIKLYKFGALYPQKKYFFEVYILQKQIL